eukprot:11221360-Lingulodinium_polyedra.AAC.1
MAGPRSVRCRFPQARARGSTFWGCSGPLCAQVLPVCRGQSRSCRMRCRWGVFCAAGRAFFKVGLATRLAR